MNSRNDRGIKVRVMALQPKGLRNPENSYKISTSPPRQPAFAERGIIVARIGRYRQGPSLVQNGR